MIWGFLSTLGIGGNLVSDYIRHNKKVLGTKDDLTTRNPQWQANAKACDEIIERVKNESEKKTETYEKEESNTGKISATLYLDDGKKYYYELSFQGKMMECKEALISLFLQAMGVDNKPNDFSEEIFRVRVVKIYSLTGNVTLYINHHFFGMDAQAYMNFKQYCQSNSISIIEPGDSLWKEIGDKVLEIQDYDIIYNFIANMDKKFFLKPEYYYEIQKNISEKEVLHDEISLTKKKQELLEIDMNDYKTQFRRFTAIISKEFSVKKEYDIEFAWKLLDSAIIKYFSSAWTNEYNNGKILMADTVEDAIDQALRIGGLGKRKDNKFAMFIYYCIFHTYTKASNFFDAWFELEKVIQERIDIRETELLEKRIKKDDIHRNNDKYTIDDIDLMSGNEFEHFICKLYSKMGYDAEVTKQSGDQGLDIIAEKNGRRIGIQTKCYTGTVGNSAVQEAAAGKSYYHCEKVVVVTNNYFTTSAKELAQANDVILWDRELLKEKIRELM